MAQLILASSSPRRVELLRQIGVSATVVAADIDESLKSGEQAVDYVQRLAKEKASCVACLITNGAIDTALEPSKKVAVLAADTIVYKGGNIFGKPSGDAETFNMLQQLSGSEHCVATAVAIIKDIGSCQSDSDGANPKYDCDVALSQSKVRFRELRDAEIRTYCATGESTDKAGAYAIQGLAAMFIEHIEGSYSGIMGLPLFETAALLQSALVPTALDESAIREL